MRTAIAIDPQAFLGLRLVRTGVELPIAAIGERERCPLAAFCQPHGDARAEVEANGVGNLAALALAARRDQQVLSAQLAAIITQDQYAPVEQAETVGITIMARLAPRGIALLGLHDAPVNIDRAHARAELANLQSMGGAVASIDYMKSRLVDSNAERLNRIEKNETIVVGVNKWTEGEPSPLQTEDGGIMVVDPAVEQEQISRLDDWRSGRDDDAVQSALAALRAAAQNGDNIMPPSIAAAKAGVTTGEWAEEMRKVYGTYRGPTGVSGSVSNKTEGLDELRDKVNAVSDQLGRRLKFLVGKPGLDGHSNGAEQIAFRARDCGMDITYDGIRMTPEELVASAIADDAHVVGMSILSGSHLPLIEELMGRMTEAGLSHVPVVVGGIIPDDDADRLKKMGVARVYTPKDFELNAIMGDIVELAKQPETATH